MIRFMNLWVQTQFKHPLGVYAAHKCEIDNDFIISDERASFIIKTIMAGIAPRIYTYKDKVVSGHEILAALKRCFDNDLVFTGKLYEEINGKTYKELIVLYQSWIEEKYVEVIEIGYDSNPCDIKYFIETIDK